MSFYYYGKQIYQFSYSLPLYQRAGGTFILWKWSKFPLYKRVMRGANATPGARTLFNTPPVMVRHWTQLQDLKGVIMTHSARELNVNHEACKTIYIGHGSGDKKFGGEGENMHTYDYQFLTGPKHIEKLRDVGVELPEEKMVKIGNIRFDDYVNGKIDYEVEMKRLGIRDRSRKNVLYAPTWRWGHGTFRKYIHRFCREITREYNLIVRPHYHDAHLLPRVRLWALANGIQNVYFSDPSNLFASDTMNDFLISDVLLSDTSSVLYEYLITGKPILVIEHGYTELHKMPPELDIMSVVDVWNESKDLNGMIGEAISSHRHQKELKAMLPRIFYFNDGKSADRAVDFMEQLSKTLE